MASPEVKTNSSSSTPQKESNNDTPFTDWSGRGNHVDFSRNETIPLTEGRFLGHGAMGGVYETTIQGHKFAWKRRFCRRKIGTVERREIEILKKLSHHHIIQLVGTYTHRQFLGLLLHPVAVCDLATFMEDFEAMFELPRGQEQAEGERRQRLDALGLPPWSWSDFDDKCNRYLYSQIGCIVAAVEYLHIQSIRHKDLKPSNILLSPNRLWLTDFGSATDFSMLSVSATENGERGTPKYFAPEVATFSPNGRAADIFSLGCILLEICTLSNHGTLKPLREQRDKLDGSFQANLCRIEVWTKELALRVVLPGTMAQVPSSVFIFVRKMLERNPEARPTITTIRRQLDMIDELEPFNDTFLVSECCKRSYIPMTDHVEETKRLDNEHLKRMKVRDDEHADEIKHLHLKTEEREKQMLAEHYRANGKLHHELIMLDNLHIEEKEILKLHIKDLKETQLESEARSRQDDKDELEIFLRQEIDRLHEIIKIHDAGREDLKTRHQEIEGLLSKRITEATFNYTRQISGLENEIQWRQDKIDSLEGQASPGAKQPSQSRESMFVEHSETTDDYGVPEEPSDITPSGGGSSAPSTPSMPVVWTPEASEAFRLYQLDREDGNVDLPETFQKKNNWSTKTVLTLLWGRRKPY